VLAASLRERFAYIDPLNYLQIEMIRRHRATESRGRRQHPGTAGANPDAKPDRRVQGAIHLTINGVAAGLRNSG
jgi:phosphoenolpyruvate carboxylase